MKGKWIGALAWGLLMTSAAPAQTWRQVGPPGGTVISLEADPQDSKKLYLGTPDGHVFSSNDQGQHWQLLSRIGTGQDGVVTHIIVDSRNSNHLYASTWTLYSGGGGVYRSDDAGRSWHVIGLQKETVRALAQSPTNPKVFVAGSLTGVYRSKDDGNSWERISPANHEDLRNLDSVAFDPKDENIIYAGTYHLPWKTTDGGKNWTSIKKGMIDDSDVMTIIVDPANPSNVHATACSGIYRSVDSGKTWKRYAGIPFIHRRTQLIRQDPQHPDTLYAGTTSGLWKTTNEGVDQWKRLTPLDWVVNAIIVDPKNPERLIIGTERQGVQISENGGATFSAANNGFHHQHIFDVAMDNDRPERALVVLTFDTNAFIATKDGGNTWNTLGPGLKRTDLRHVYAAPRGWLASLSAGGLMRYDEAMNKWSKFGAYLSGASEKASVGPSKPLSFQVNDLFFTSNAWFAATSGGVLISLDKGATWRSAGSDPFAKQPAQSLEASLDGSQIWAISQRNLLYSSDSGNHWDAKELNFASAGNLHLHKVDDSNLYLTSNMGLYVSRDAGKNWNRADVRDLQFQDVAGSGAALVASLQKHGLITSFDSGKSWQRVNDPVAEGYFPVLQARRNGSVVAASATEGILTLETGARSAEGVGSSALVPSGNLQKPR
jgi:photosystem II stability/assembly factor-like uncharacterized protein